MKKKSEKKKEKEEHDKKHIIIRAALTSCAVLGRIRPLYALYKFIFVSEEEEGPGQEEEPPVSEEEGEKDMKQEQPNEARAKYFFSNKFKYFEKRKHGFQKMHHSKGFYTSQNKAKFSSGPNVINNTALFWSHRLGVINYWYVFMIYYFREQLDIIKITVKYFVLVVKSFFI